MAKTKTTPRKAPKEITRLSDLKTQRRNINKGKPHGLAALDSSIRRNGYGAPMVAAASGELFVGSKRLERSADIFGLDVKPIVVESDGTRPIVHIRTDIKTADDPRAQEMGYEDNVITVMGWNPDGELLAQLAKENEIVAALAKQENESLKALRELGDGKGSADAEPQIDKAEELLKTWKVERGQLWGLGDQRLICGDSALRDDVATVMDGGKAGMVFTDPPYNVAYSGLGQNTRETIENDDMPDDEFYAWLLSVCKLIDEFSERGSPYYLCHGDTGNKAIPFINVFSDCGWVRSSTIIWSKDSASMGWQDYRSQHECISYGWKPGDNHYFTDSRSETTIWEISRDARAGYNHPTQKPIELPSKAIKNSSVVGSVLYEPFAGSGTTIIACENLGRYCRAVEISPAYVSVCLQRYLDATGKTPVLLNG